MKVSVKDGSKRKKFPHDLKHNVSTTLDFGFCQPLMSRELSADDTVNLSIPQFVRLGVVVKPTFGRMSLRTYIKFVPIETVYEPYGSFQAGQQFSHGGHSYIPSEVYNVRIMDLWRLCCLHSQMSIFLVPDIADSGDGVIFTAPDVHSVYIPDNFQEYINMMWFGENLGQGALSALNTIHGILKIERLLIEEPTEAQLNMDYYDWFLPTKTKDERKVLMCGRFTRAGRNLRSILIGCGHQFNLSSVRPRSLLNLIAYYKSYFDLFNPNREKTWKDTHCYRFIERANTNNSMSASKIFYQANDSTLCGNFLTWFLIELPTCYYTYNPDYVSAHITGTALNASTQSADNPGSALSGPSFPLIDGVNNLSAVGSPGSGKNVNLTPPQSAQSLSNVNRSVLRVLDILSKRINAHTAIGTRIGAYLRSVFGSAYLENDSVDNLGSQSFDIDIDDVMSFAETDLAALGQYAGRGIGAIDAEHAEHITFTAPTPGFLVTFVAMVPEAGYSQGYDKLLEHVTRRQFFDPDFDGVTLLPNEQINIYGVSELAGFGSYSESFGNIPVYSEYKVAYNVLNGDMSRNSTRNTFLPFTLDKLLPYIHIGKVNASSNQIRMVVVDSETLVNGEIWRYCNRDRWLGNFNRVFLEAGQPFPTNFFDDYNFFLDIEGAEDNFIVHNIVDLKVSSYALPLKDSFDTGSFDGATFDVQKA